RAFQISAHSAQAVSKIIPSGDQEGARSGQRPQSPLFRTGGAWRRKTALPVAVSQTPRWPSAVPAVTRAPSGEKASPVTSQAYLARRRGGFPPPAIQRRTAPSQLPEASCWELGEKASAWTLPL